MSDQCKNCTLRGDIKACQAVECSHHESWYVSAVKEQLEADKAQLQRENAELKRDVLDLMSDSCQKHNNKLRADAIREALCVLFPNECEITNDEIKLCNALENYANSIEGGE